MWTYILRRVLISIPLLIGILTINFFIIHAAPGDPTDIFYNPDMSPEAKENIKKMYGLDKPVIVQYANYVTGVAQLEFGTSFAKKRPVVDVVLDALPNTIMLGFLALTLYMFLGIIVGIIAAVKQYSAFDNSVRVAALTFYSMPSFYLGLLFLFLFAGGIFEILPPSGMYDVVNYDKMSFLERFWDRFLHFLLPTLTIALGGAAGISRYMRGQLLEVIRQDYIRTARAKGLAERWVIFKHGLRNAMMPIITIMGLSLPFLLSGTIIVEVVFSWPGMGQVAWHAITQRDYPVFLATNILLASMVLIGNMVADILYAVVDPRVRMG